MSDKPELRYGSDWADHEDCIVGNEAGLARLRDACKAALRDGEYFGNDLGEFIGVKRLESSWFKNQEVAKSTRVASFVLGVVLLGVFALVVVGIVTVVRWAIA